MEFEAQKSSLSLLTSFFLEAFLARIKIELFFAVTFCFYILTCFRLRVVEWERDESDLQMHCSLQSSYVSIPTELNRNCRRVVFNASVYF